MVSLLHPSTFFHCSHHEKILQILGGGNLSLIVLLLLSLDNRLAVAQVQHPNSAAPTVLALSPLSSNTIHYKGPVGTTGLNTRFDPLDLCPNTVNPTAGTISSLRYMFEFQSTCVGEGGYPFYPSVRPPFIWSLQHTTEQGHYYNEQ